VEEFMDDKVVIMDPAEGRITLSIEVLEKMWDICNNLAILIRK
jgi:predicted double-glycine peptidase